MAIATARISQTHSRNKLARMPAWIFQTLETLYNLEANHGCHNLEEVYQGLKLEVCHDLEIDHAGLEANIAVKSHGLEGVTLPGITDICPESEAYHCLGAHHCP